MNLSQKQSILNNIETILSFDFDKFIVENNSTGNIDDIKLGDYSVVEFKNLYNKVFNQLRSELESGLDLMLPNQETFNNEFSSVTLDVETGYFSNYLQNFSNRNSAAEILRRFIYYQIRQGFWNKSAVKSHNINQERLNAAQANLELVEKSLSENTKVFNSLKENIEKYIEDLKAIYANKTEESENITSLLEKAKNEGSSITTLLSTSTNSNSEITRLLSVINGNQQTIQSDISNYEDKFAEIEISNKNLSDQLTKDLESAKTNLDQSKEGNTYISNQKEEITRLIGMAADGTLGYKFNSRKVDLENGINNFWRWAVPGSILIALIWVFVIFTCLKAHLENEWINLIINLIKTSPAWVLVGFVFTQYGKERNLQEEYAFKTAIAMTLTSYSQMLSEEDSNPNKSKSSKQEMLLKSIENLYTQPVLKIEKGESNDLLNSKQLAESFKAISEMVKNIKN